MKLGDLMSMFSLNAGDSQSMGRRIFRRPYLFMRHRARRMEHRIARAVSAGGISGGVAGAVAGSAVANKRAERKNTASKENRGNTTSSMGQRAGSKVGAVLDTKNKVKDKANAVKENIKDMPTQTAYAVYSAKEKAKSSVSDFKRGMVQEQQSRQTGRLEKQEQHRQNIADKRMELQKAQEARQAQRKSDGSATTGATRPHERPATASKPSAEKMQEVKRPATATTSKASEPVKTNVIKERPLSSGASDRKATQIKQAMPVPIIFVTSRDTNADELKSIQVGGIDFITKPYDTLILLEKIKRALQLSNPNNFRELVKKDCTLDLHLSILKYQEKSIELTRNEFRILYYFFMNEDKVISKEELLEKLWNDKYYLDENVLLVNMTRLKKKMKEIGIVHLLENIRGKGWKL